MVGIEWAAPQKKEPERMWRRTPGLNITYHRVSLLHECISRYPTKALVYEERTPAVAMYKSGPDSAGWRKARVTVSGRKVFIIVTSTMFIMPYTPRRNTWMGSSPVTPMSFLLQSNRFLYGERSAGAVFPGTVPVRDGKRVELAARWMKREIYWKVQGKKTEFPFANLSSASGR